MQKNPNRTPCWQEISWPWPVLAAALFVGLALLRAWRLEQSVGTYSGCLGCFWLSSLGHDAWLLALMLGAIALGYLGRWGWLRLVARAAACLILLVFAGDLATDTLFSQRLYFADLVRFGQHAGNDWSVMRAAFASRAGLIAAAVGVLVLLASLGMLIFAQRRMRAGIIALVAAFVSGGFSLYAASRPLRYVHDLFLDNVIEANLPQGRVQMFSPGFIKSEKALAQVSPQQCGTNTAANGSVIVLMVESLSAWQSGLLGGTQDWTPKIDALARSNHFFRNFYANGFTTSTGEIAIFSGHTPLIPPGKAWFDFGDYADGQGSLPDIAHRSHRQAAFFTTGDLSFLGLGAWLHRIGFDVVDGSDAPFYIDRKRWQFGAAEDASLYDRVLAWIDERDNTRPFVAALETVSSHPPFVDPRSGAVDARGTFRYVDEQIARFHDELERRGFFKTGILLVLGDHRSMTPLREEEFRAYGERAFARIPMLVFGAVDMPPVIDAAFQQTDIAPSIGQWLGLRECRGAFTGLFLRADPQPADYVLHVRGDNRNRVDLYHGAGLSSFLLDGDASSWMGTPPPEADFVAGWINWQREEARDRGVISNEPGSASK